MTIQNYKGIPIGCTFLQGELLGFEVFYGEYEELSQEFDTEEEAKAFIDSDFKV